MGPRFASEALSLIAELIELEEEPSRSGVASDLREVLQLVEGPDTFGARVAIFDTLKKLKRKVFDTKGERKILEKIDRLKKLKKKVPKLVRDIRKGADFADIAADDDYASIIFNIRKDLSGGSKMIAELAGSSMEYAIVAALGEMDDHYAGEGDDDEEGDRQILVKAVSAFDPKADKKIKDLEGRLGRQKKEQKKGKKLDKPGRPKELLKRKEEPEDEIPVEHGELEDEKPEPRLTKKP